jgi:hypothetical protein
MSQTTVSPTPAAQLETDLAHFTGTETYTNLRYPWLRKRFLLTDGVQYLAEKAQAYWLMDAIAAHQINKKVANEPFQVWILTVNEHRQARLTCNDGNNTLLTFQKIEYTDFPLSEITLYASQDDYLGGRVVMLTSEY